LYEALKKEKLTALGPMTNIATLIQNHPDIIPQIEKIKSVQQERQGYYSIQKRKIECVRLQL
jgi:pyrimidine-specific ribonucleoside hydrolase